MKVSDFVVNLTDLTATIYANVLAIPLNYFYDGGVGGGGGWIEQGSYFTPQKIPDLKTSHPKKSHIFVQVYP